MVCKLSPTFNHQSFMFSSLASELVYRPLLNLLHERENSRRQVQRVGRLFLQQESSTEAEDRRLEKCLKKREKGLDSLPVILNYVPLLL